jgi:outer membrane protein assembly factor BamB
MCRSNLRIQYLSLAAAVCLALVPLTAAAAEPELLYWWELNTERVKDHTFGPLAGHLSVTAGEQPAFSDDQPHALKLSTQQRLTISDDPAKVLWPTESLSVEAWVMIDQSQEWGGIVSAIQDNGNYERGWLLGYRGSRFCFGLASEKANRLTYLTADEEFAFGSWYHVAATYDGSTMRLYVDGREVASSTEQAGKIVYPPKLFFDLAAYHDDNEHYPLLGQLAEVRISRGAIAPETIAAKFKADKEKYPGAVAEVEVTDVAGWPTYLHDNARSGITPEQLALPLELAWSYRAPLPPDPAWPPPAKQDFWHNKHALKARVTYDRAFQVISDGERVWFGSSADDQVRCLDQHTGREIWSVYTEGPVRLAPTLYQEKLYFGSDDGCAYCVEAATGIQVWKKRAIETDRRLPGNGRMISTWPIRTGILVENNQARFAAGLFPTQGVFQYVLDAQTGEELVRGELGFSPQGYMELKGNQLMVSQGRAPQAFVDRLKRTGKAITPQLEAMPEDYPYAWIGAGTHRFGGGEGKVAAFAAEDGRQLWQDNVEGNPYSLAVAGDSLLVSTSAGMIYCYRTAGTPKRPGPPRGSSNEPDDEPLPIIAQAAERIVQLAGNAPGWCLVLNSHDGHLPHALSKLAPWKIVAATQSPSATHRARKNIAREQGDRRVAVHQLDSSELPYQSQLFNTIVVDGGLSGEIPRYSASSLFRLLRPGGEAILGLTAKNLGQAEAAVDPVYRRILTGWAKELPEDAYAWNDQGEFVITKPAKQGTGSWSHMYANPANTSCSEDQLVGNKFHLQWFGQPGPREMLDRHHRTVPPLVVDGRIFVPADNRVIAVDAYNGTILWDQETPYSRRVAAMRDAGSMAAAADRVYVATAGECVALDAKTGEQMLRTPVPPATDGQPRHWGYVALMKNGLFGSATKPGASRGEHSRQQINETYWDDVPIVTSDYLYRLDRHSGELVWRYDPTGGALLNPTFTIGGRRVYFIESKNPATLSEKTGRSKLSDFLGQGAQLVALDRDSGKELWRQDVPLEQITQHLYLCYAKEKLIAVGTRNERQLLRNTVRYDVAAFAAADGASLWQTTQDQGQGVNGDHGEQDHHPTIVGDTVIVEPKAYDLNTGEPIAGWSFARGGHGCGTISASAKSLFFRADNPTMVDLATGTNQKVTAVSRPGCWINIIPADGLLLIPEASSGCTCNFSIQASMAFAPEE